MSRFRGSDREQPTPPRPPVSIKGRADGLRIAIARADAADVESSLRQQLASRSGQFFLDAAVTLEMPPGPLDLVLAARLGEIVHEAGMRVTAVLGGVDGSRSRQADAGTGAAAPASVPADAALVVHRTLRSGQRIVHAGTVVIFGDVNAGAEVVAGGSVIVWGRLRGVVEAGLAEADALAAAPVVCALDLAPTQLRIGAAIARAPEEPGRVPEPEIARAVDGAIVVESWDHGLSGLRG